MFVRAVFTDAIRNANELDEKVSDDLFIKFERLYYRIRFLSYLYIATVLLTYFAAIFVAFLAVMSLVLQSHLI